MARFSPFRLLGTTAACLLLAGCAMPGGETGETGETGATPVPAPVTPGTEEGVPTNFLDLEVGDCFDIPSNLPAGEALKYSSCDVLHLYEAFAGTVLPESEFPGEDGVHAAGNEFCEPAFEAFVGESWQTSDFDFQPIVPSERTWNEVSDRKILCMATTLSDLPWSGSAANGGR